jgi:hypothetical protein
VRLWQQEGYEEHLHIFITEKCLTFSYPHTRDSLLPIFLVYHFCVPLIIIYIRIQDQHVKTENSIGK